jgi:hypothetical protein
VGKSPAPEAEGVEICESRPEADDFPCVSEDFWTLSRARSSMGVPKAMQLIFL